MQTKRFYDTRLVIFSDRSLRRAKKQPFFFKGFDFRLRFRRFVGGILLKYFLIVIEQRENKSVRRVERAALRVENKIFVVYLKAMYHFSPYAKKAVILILLLNASF